MSAKELVSAVRQQNLKKVQALLASGANPNELVGTENPLVAVCIYAVPMGLTKKTNDIIAALLSAGATPDVTFGPVSMPLLSFVASKTTDAALTNLFLMYGADANAKSASGTTPLIEAILKRDNVNNIQILLNAPADPNIPDNMSKFPIHYAIDSQNVNIVQMLLDKGASIDVTYGGRTIQEYTRTSSSAIRALFGLEGEAEAAGAAAAAAPNSSPGSKLPATPAASMIKPMQCFDPIIPDTVDIDPSYTVFYIRQPDKSALAYCIDSVTLNEYKTKNAYVFYRCKSTVPVGALHISQSQIEPTKLRRFDLGQRVYVNDTQAKKLKPGKAYLLEVTTMPIGRIVSDQVIKGGSVVGAVHCQDIEPGFVYSLKMIGTTKTRVSQARPGSKVGGRRRLRRTRKNRK